MCVGMSTVIIVSQTPEIRTSFDRARGILHSQVRRPDVDDRPPMLKRAK
jgi:hypothetical protein